MRRSRALLALFACVLLALGGCARLTVTGRRVPQAETVLPKAYDERLRTDQNADLPVVGAQYLSLYVDRVTMAPKLVDSTTGYVWRTLPSSAAGMAWTVAVTLTGAAGSYLLDAQSCSVAHGTASYAVTEDGMEATYAMAPDEQTAKKSPDALSEQDIYCRVTVRYALSAQSLTVTIPADGLVCPRGWSVTEVSLLPLLGTDKDLPGDRVVVPDGSGAVMELEYTDENTRSVAFDVYGADPACGASPNAPAAMPVFGLKRGDSAFAALVTGGAEYAVIRADRALSGSGSRVYASFRPTPVYGTESARYLGETVNTDLQVTYLFLSGADADYSGMARALRDLMTRLSHIRSRAADPAGHAMLLTVVGLANGETL